MTRHEVGLMVTDSSSEVVKNSPKSMFVEFTRRMGLERDDMIGGVPVIILDIFYIYTCVVRESSNSQCRVKDV